MCEGGGNCLKYLKRGWDRKEGRGHKDFKKGGKLGQGVGTLKGLRTMEKVSVHINVCMSKIICMPIKVSVCMYVMYVIFQTLEHLSFSDQIIENVHTVNKLI